MDAMQGETDMGKHCQSCGMPLKKDPQGGGSNADGTRSQLYCSLCYGDGAFYAKDMNAKEFQALCVQKMKENGMPGVLAWLLTRQIPKLGRWTQG